MLDISFTEAVATDSQDVLLPKVTEILSGGTPKTKVSSYWDKGTIPFFAPGDVSSSIFTLATKKHITKEGLENCNSALFPTETVFLTARGTVGKVAMAGQPMAMNQSCFAFIGKGIPQSVVFQVIKNAVSSLRTKANGATFAAINTLDLKIETVKIPDEVSLARFAAQADKWLALALVNEKENMRLRDLRDSLLPKLMSGEIDVSKIDLSS